jgi:hypothetical protein
MARRPAHAQCAPHTKPRHGPRSGKSRPQSVNRRPSIPIKWLRVDPGRSKSVLAPSPKTLAFILSTPSSLFHAAMRAKCERIRESDGAAAGPLVGARDHQWVDAPPSSGSSAGSFIAHKPATASPRASMTAPSRTMATSHSRRWRRPLPTQHPVKQRRPWRVPSPQPRAVARDLPTRQVDPSTASDGGHVVNTMR